MSEFIQTLDKSRRIDDPRFWAERDVITQPDFDLTAFQKKLDLACGKTREGLSIVRCSWAWDTAKCFSMFFTDWDVDGEPTKHELRAKYIYKTVEIARDDHVDIPPPRFVFEEIVHPAQYHAAWEANRWQFDPKLGRKVPTRPLPPRDGYYSFLFYAAIHDPDDACCARAQKAGQECFGVYRLPSQADVDYFARLTGKLARKKNRPNPYRPFDEKVLAAIFKDTEAEQQENFEKKKIQEQEDLLEFAEIIRPLAAYSLPSNLGERKSPGGIILP